MNKLFNDPAFLVSSWSAIIFLSFAVGLLIQNRRLKKRIAEDWALLQQEQATSAEYAKELRREIKLHLGRIDTLQQSNRHNFESGREALELRQQSAEAAAMKIAELEKETELFEIALRHNHLLGDRLTEVEQRALLLHKILCKVHPVYNTFKNDNSKIEKHLAFLEKPKKRKSRAKAIKQAI